MEFSTEVAHLILINLVWNPCEGKALRLSIKQSPSKLHITIVCPKPQQNGLFQTASSLKVIILMYKHVFFQRINSWRLNLSRICPVFRVVQMQDFILQYPHIYTGKYDWKQKFIFLHLWLDQHLTWHFKYCYLKYLVKMSSWTKPPHLPYKNNKQGGCLKVSEANPSLTLWVKDEQDPHLIDFKNYLTLSSTRNSTGIRAKNSLHKYFISLKS